MGSPSPAGARALGPPGMGMGPGRGFSPLQSQNALPQQQQGPPGFQPGPPGMGSPTSPQLQRASFSALGAPSPSPYGHPAASATSPGRPNGLSPIPGAPVNLPSGGQQQAPAPIGRGHPSHSQS